MKVSLATDQPANTLPEESAIWNGSQRTPFLVSEHMG